MIKTEDLIKRIENLKAERERTAYCLAQLEAELENRKKETPLGVPFMPKNEEDYWLIESRGFPFFTHNKDSFDVATTKFLNSFHSKESAEKHSEMLLAWRKDGLLANAKGEPIDIKVLLPLLEKGYVAMNKNGKWYWYKEKPYIEKYYFCWNTGSQVSFIGGFNIKPAEDWRKSLMECGL